MYKAIEAFVGDSFGVGAWHRALRDAGLWDLIGPEGFDIFRSYEDALAQRLIVAAADETGRSSESLLEDLGTYLVSHPRVAALRRLLRFGGSTYTDFLGSLDELPGRARLAVADLALPELVLADEGERRFRLECRACPEGFGHVLLGILRALADDYGALVMVEHCGARQEGEALAIAVYDPAFHAGKQFDLAGLERRAEAARPAATVPR